MKGINNMFFYQKAVEKWNNIAIPINSLGILQENICKICNIQQTLRPDISKKCVVVFCADNGIVHQNISQVGQEVTSLVAKNMILGKSSVCKMAEVAKIDVFPIDIGMNSEKTGILDRRIMNGTNDFSTQKAMSKEQVLNAIKVGEDFVEQNLKYSVFAIGEMGIGNTTTSSAIASVLLDISVENITDLGAGLSKKGLEHKIDVIEKAINFHKPNKKNIFDVLSKVGGLDICGMIGIMLGCKKFGKMCILDGFITLVAYICAEKIENDILENIIASHTSGYKKSEEIMKNYKLQSVINANMKLGEGTGAVAVMPILDMAVKIFNEMPTFNEINIDNYEKFEEKI